MILVGDQSRTTADLLVRRLRVEGFQAEAAASSFAVMERVRAGGIAAVVLDPGLPGAPYEAMSDIRSAETTNQTPVVVISSTDRPGESDAAIAAGSSAFLVKGHSTPSELVERLRSLVRQDRGSPDAVPRGTPSSSGTAARVLLVDDEPLITRSIAGLLRSSGFDAHCAADAYSALQLLETTDFAVIISDERMPWTTGVDFLQICSRQHPAATRILLTGYADANKAADAVHRAEIFRLLLKPWSNEDLVAVTRQAAWKSALARDATRR